MAALGVDELADVTWLGSKLTDQPLLSFTQPLPHASGEHPAIPRTYIHCTEGPIVSSFAPFANAASKDPTWAYHELANGHDAMITEPDGLAALLLAG